VVLWGPQRPLGQLVQISDLSAEEKMNPRRELDEGNDNLQELEKKLQMMKRRSIIMQWK